MHPDLHFRSLMKISDQIKSGELTSLAATEALLARIAKLDGTLMSYMTVCAERAVAQAKQADADISRGIWRGPLHGVPIAIKDLSYTTFAPTSGGMTIYRDFVADHNATVVDRLEASGAVILGKLTMTEGAYTSHHPDIPAPPNTWGADRWVGSSSTGSAVATSAGMCFGSLGTDTGGSIRFPSATCGLTGIKPTWGRVSRYGNFALADSMDHIGPMARSAEDCAAILQAIAGWDANDPTSIDMPVPDYLAATRHGVRDMIIGIDPTYAYNGTDSSVAEALKTAVAVFEKLGARIVEVELPAYEKLVASWIMMCSVETAAAHEATYPARADEYGPELKQLIDQGHATSGIEVAKGTQMRHAFTEALSTMFNGIDCLLAPAMPVPTPTLTKMGEYGEDPTILNSILRYTAPFDFSGHPSITLPNGIDTDGLLHSMQIVGPWLAEDTLIAAGHAYQTVTDWHRRHPDVG